MSSPGARWRDALAALALLDTGAGGILVHAREGPARQAWIRALEQNASGVLRVAPSADVDQLRGGRDLLASLMLGRPVHHQGLVQRLGNRVLLVCGAERLAPRLAALLADSIDAGLDRFVLVDEGEPAGVPAILRHRSAMQIRLDGIGCADIDGAVPATGSAVDSLPEPAVKAFCEAAMRLGLAGSSAELHACRVARAATGCFALDEAVELASRLVLAPRASAAEEPDAESSKARDAPNEDCCDAGDEPPGESTERDGAADRVIDAVRSVLPELADARTRMVAGGGGAAGHLAARRGAVRHGRPGRRKAGLPGRGGSLDLIGTLLAAAANGRSESGAILRIARTDIRIRAVKPSRREATVFAVDASGSLALARLAEVKGAVESVLARSYVRRDEMALIAFRHASAETIIPRTRSLARARRELAAMPGGGATPLAAGLMEALAEAIRAEKAGSGALIVVMTDGGANVALDGRTDRVAAREDSLNAARAIAASGIPAVLVDSNPRPGARLRELAQAMNARTLPLPRLQPGQISEALAEARAA